MTDRPIGIIGAMDVEVDGLKALMTEKETVTISGIEFVSGLIAGRNVVVAKCGVGKVFAAICTQTMILRYSPSLIINTGVGGTLTDGLSLGDIAIATSVVQHDMDTSAVGDPVGMISGINVIEISCDEKSRETISKAARNSGKRVLCGTVSSGDKFICEKSEKERISKLFGSIACDMESAGIGHVCYVNNTPCCIIRSISDSADEKVSMSYETFKKIAAETSINLLVSTLPEL